MNRKNKDYYVLKCDIHKYFYNIDKNILYKIMCKYINDKKLLWLTRVFIFDDNNSVGIPIGNYTSQYFANIYLNELDHYVKKKLKIKYYVRYMDDFVILLDTKEECKQVLEQIIHFVNSELKLEMNSKSRYYPNKMGIDFCGYRIFNTHLLLRKRCVYNIKKDLRIWFKLKEDGVLNMDKVQRSYNSFLAHAKHASSYNICFIIGNIMALL